MYLYVSAVSDDLYQKIPAKVKILFSVRCNSIYCGNFS